MTKATGPLNKLIEDALRCLAAQHEETAPLELQDWRPVTELCRRTSAATLKAAIALSKSPEKLRRVLGAIVLGRLGNRPQKPGGVFREERYLALKELFETEMGAEADPDVMADICSAFCKLDDRRAAPVMLPLFDHPSAQIRFLVALAISGHDDEATIQALIRLSADPEEEIREVATLSFTQVDADSAAIRAALHKRLDDRFGETKDAAIRALARRKDRSVLPFLFRELVGKHPFTLLEAAKQMADPSLCPALQQVWKKILGRIAHNQYEALSWQSACQAAMDACDCRM